MFVAYSKVKYGTILISNIWYKIHLRFNKYNYNISYKDILKSLLDIVIVFKFLVNFQIFLAIIETL